MEKSETERYITTVVDAALTSEDSSVKQAYKVIVQHDGFLFIPRMPSSLILDAALYYKIYDIVAGALFPAYTVIRATTMQLVQREDSLSMARAFFYPWKVGVSERLVAPTYDSLPISSDRYTVTLMKGMEYDLRKAPHFIISGGSGSGKTVATKYFLNTFLRKIGTNGRLILIDVKKSHGARWAKQHPEVDLLVPHPGDRPEDFLPRVTEKLAEVIDEMNRRQDFMFNQSADKVTDYSEFGDPIFVIIEEAQALTVGLKKNLLETFQSQLKVLSLLSREANITLGIIAQSAMAEIFGGSQVRQNVGLRLLLGRIDKESAQFLFPELESGFPLPIGGKGTGIVSINDGEHFGIEPIAMPTVLEDF